MKLDKLQKEFLAELKAEHKEIGGKIFTFDAMGITIAIAPAVAGNNCNFVQFSIAQCSPSDKFNKKRGELIAITRFASGFTMSKRIVKGNLLQDEAESIALFFNEW